MFAHLKKGRAIELSKIEKNICGADDYKGSLPGLYQRGLIDIEEVALNGKMEISVFITKSGISFLDRYEEDAKKSENE